MNYGRTKRTIKLIDDVIKLRREGLDFAQIGERLGISKQYAGNLYRDHIDSRPEEDERLQNIAKVVAKEINGHETFECVIFPFERSFAFNQITIPVTIKSCLEGEERIIAIESELQKALVWKEC